MKQIISFILIVLLVHIVGFGQEPVKDTLGFKTADSLDINDGPYVFISGDSLIEKTIKDGIVTTTILDPKAFPIKYKAHNTINKSVDKIIALSDIHGQYDLAVKLLMNNNIIDNQLNWKFGNGHLVIAGDIFDRGDKVNEVLWLVYKLEQQAIEAGGMLHYLLGNHEYMVFLDDYRYVNKKYLAASRLLNRKYSQLYGPDTVLGRWLRSKNTVIKINDMLFLHGGISKDFVETGFKLNSLNKLMRSSIDDESLLASKEFFDKYFGSNGPIWYRGYFYDNLPETQIDSILQGVKSEHIIVGHCSFDSIIRRYEGKIFGVDSSIKLGDNGEILIIDKTGFRRGLLNGTIQEFKE